MRRVRSRNEVFLDNQGAEIVAAKPERNLPDLHPHGDPACLEVGHVVEDYSRKSDSAEIFSRARLGLVRHRRSILGLQRPADESREATGSRLHFPHSLEMLQT